MKFFKFVLFLTIFLSFCIFDLKYKISLANAQSPIQCGLNNEACCNLAGSPANSCQKGLVCNQNKCVPDGSEIAPPTRGVVTGSAIPDGGKVPCADIKNPEFNSDRPYQASPCGDSPKAYFCENSVVLTIGSVSTPYTGPGYQKCTGKCSGELKQLIIDLTNVQLPVLGNTQQTKNSVNSTPSIDDATRLNEYVSSYLNGTNYQAEYGGVDPNKIIDFSGPIKKLLPGAIQDAQRINTIERKDITYTPEAEGNKDTPQPTSEPVSHDQIVACATKKFFGLFGDEIPYECYKNGTPFENDEFRLSKWQNQSGDLGIARKLSDVIVSQLLKIPGVTSSLIGQSLSEAWNQRIPPVPWGNGQDGKKFDSYVKYQKAYNEWQGKSCVIVPFINFLICFDLDPTNLFISSDWANLYPYIPLANTTDKISGQTINSVEIKSDDATFDSKGYDSVKAPKLYFAHTQESADLSALLQKTFKSDNESGQTIPSDVENNSTCQILKSYSNPGDNATFDKPKSSLEVDGIFYKVDTIKCPNDVERRKKCTDPNDPKTCKDVTPDCSADITVTIPMQNKTPYLNEIWSNTVAGDQSIFRRIYPKTGVNSPVSCVADIPGASKITYTSDTEPKIDRVIEPDGSGTGAGGGDKSVDAQIYFPHLGGMADYFLKGIQTALRPQGYGEPVISNECSTGTSPGFGQCKYSANEVEAAKKAAAKKYGIPEALLQAVLEIEGAEWFLDSNSYECKENDAHAAGLMQITRSAYDYVTCPNERYIIDADSTSGICKSQSPKLSRCDVFDNFELAARTLLWKFGLTANCNATGPAPTDKISIYNATCKYYGTFDATPETINYENGIPVSERRQDGLHMNYCDIVCHKMGACPPYPVQ